MSTPLRLLAADDEATARRRLTRLLGLLPDVELLACVESGEALLRALRAHARPDGLLLDISMPGLDGLELAALLPTPAPPVVFVTAHPQHALRAFGVGACDYLLKPIDAEGLRRALGRIRQLRPLGSGQEEAGPLALRTPRGIRLVRVEEIRCLVLDDTSLTVWLRDGQQIVDHSLRELEARLAAAAPGRFVRISRRALVQLDQIDMLVRDGIGWAAKMRGGPTLSVSRQAARDLKARLG